MSGNHFGVLEMYSISCVIVHMIYVNAAIGYDIQSRVACDRVCHCQVPPDDTIQYKLQSMTLFFNTLSREYRVVR